jgi:hexosaminidase
VDTDLTYDFIDDVLGEVAALTPGPYLHVGGDEVFTMPPADYVGFLNRVQPIVTAHGKTVVGWHQVAPAEHEAGRVLQFWGTAPTDPTLAEAVRRGARVILSPGNRAYLDMKYTDQTPLGKDWAGPVEVRQAYDWDPGSYLVDVPADAVLGVEAPLWTETISTLSQAEFMTFPRLPAIAELGWSPASTHDWASFRCRLGAQGPRWTAAGIAFHPSPQVPWAQPADVSGPADLPGPVYVPASAAVEADAVPAVPAASTPADLPAGSPTRLIGPVSVDPDPAGDPASA